MCWKMDTILDWDSGCNWDKNLCDHLTHKGMRDSLWTSSCHIDSRGLGLLLDIFSRCVKSDLIYKHPMNHMHTTHVEWIIGRCWAHINELDSNAYHVYLIIAVKCDFTSFLIHFNVIDQIKWCKYSLGIM